MGLLSNEELAYMRATQSEARPTLAQHLAKVTERTPTGGTRTGWAEPREVTVRIDGAPDEIPAELAGRWEGGNAYTLTLTEALDIRDGDLVRVSPTEEYEVITDGDPDRWATAQVLYARRLKFPTRTVA